MIDLPHYKIRGGGGGKCVPWEQVLRNSGLSLKEIKAAMQQTPQEYCET